MSRSLFFCGGLRASLCQSLRRGYAAPPFHSSAWSFHCARKLACGTPCFTGLTTACFRHRRRPSCAPLVNPSVAATPRHLPLHKGGFWTVLLPAVVPLSKRLPCLRGAVGASRLRGCLLPLSTIRAASFFCGGPSSKPGYPRVRSAGSSPISAMAQSAPARRSVSAGNAVVTPMV